MKRVWKALVDLVLGSRCHVCDLRVFPRDKIAHYRVCCRRA